MRRRWVVLLWLIPAAACARSAELNLDRLKLPSGFQISIFAQAPGARMMAFSPGGVLLVTETDAGKVVALPDPQHAGKASRVAEVLTGLNLPHGIAFHEGKLYVAETNAVSRYDWDEQNLRASNRASFATLPSGGGHFTRTIVFAGDKLYVSVGSDCNVCTKQDPRSPRRATVLEYTSQVYLADTRAGRPGPGSVGRIFASGLRNAVGLAVNPKTGTVWATENGRDNLGDDVPPDEINDLGRGGDFGWPYCYGSRQVDPAHRAEGEKRCPSTIPPVAELQAHSAPLGLAFYDGTSFPPEYRNNLFIAYHGSWNRSAPTGYKVVRIPLNDSGKPNSQVEEFITGWLPSNASRRAVMGRPVGVAFGPDGAMYISDDDAGVVYRVTYRK